MRDTVLWSDIERRIRWTTATCRTTSRRSLPRNTSSTELYGAAERDGGETAEERRRLDEIRVQLDRYWDLLRRRRAQEEFGLDPDGERLRSTGTVEHYQQ
jgi:hypothetical protein